MELCSPDGMIKSLDYINQNLRLYPSPAMFSFQPQYLLLTPTQFWTYTSKDNYKKRYMDVKDCTI